MSPSHRLALALTLCSALSVPSLAATDDPTAKVTIYTPVGYTATHLRAVPSEEARSLALLPNGTRVQLLGQTAYGDGYRWQLVRTLNGLVGWAVASAL